MKILGIVALCFAAVQPAWAQESGPEQLVQRITDEVMAAIQELTGQVEAGVYNERPID